MGHEGYPDHPLGWTPRHPRARVPGTRTMLPPHGPCRILQPPPGLDSPSPPGRCARFLGPRATAEGLGPRIRVGQGPVRPPRGWAPESEWGRAP